jgi:proteasome lid subunit RPN8/RPN11
MILRVREAQWTPFIDDLRGRRDVETAGIILAERLQGGDVLLAKEFIAIPEDGYLIREVDQIRIDPVAINRIARKAREGDLSLITVHTHPGTNRPWFSRADDEGDSRFIPSLFAQMEGPHGSMVIAGDTGEPICRAWTEAGRPQEVSVRVVGKSVHVHRSAVSDPDEGEWFNRQALALGEDGQAVLRQLHVGIVGLGGTGSVAFAQLAHLGVGRITVVDGDRVEASNVPASH